MLGAAFERDAAGARDQGGAGGEDRGADHAVGAADDGHAAVVALVGVLDAGTKNAREFVGADHGERGERNGDVELVEDDLAGGVGAFAHVEAGFDAEERDRHVGAAAGIAAGPVTRDGVETRRNVERDLEGLAFVEPEDGVEVVTRDRLGKARAEETVDDAVGLFRHVRIVISRAAGLRPAFELGECEGGGRAAAAREHHVHDGALLTELAGAGKGVAAVVARTDEQGDSALFDAGILETLHDEFGGGRAGALHQRIGAELVGGAHFQILQFVCGENGKAHDRVPWVLKGKCAGYCTRTLLMLTNGRGARTRHRRLLKGRLIQRAVKPLHSWGGYKAPMGIWLKNTHS